MPERTTLLSQAPLPLDGASLASGVLPDASQGRLVLQGEIRFDYAGLLLDGAHADEADSLLQIEPGTWTVIAAEPATHRYILAPVSSLQGPVTVRLNVDALVDRFLIPPSEVQQNLSGSLMVSLERVMPVLPWWQSTTVMGGTAFMAVLGVAMGVRYWRRMSHLRAAQDADLKTLERELRDAFTRLESLGRSAPTLSQAAHELVPMRRSSEALMATAFALREKVRGARAGEIAQRVSRLEDKERSAEEDQALAAARTQLELLAPLLEEERGVKSRLEGILESLRTLHAAWQTLSAPQSGQEVTRASELLSEVERQVTAAVATHKEMQRL